MRFADVAEAAARPLSEASAALFAVLSAARGKRFFHPFGSAFEGTVTFLPDGDLPFSGSHRAIVRLSRGAGLPGPLPDVLGLALRIPDLDQDLLLATSGENAATRHMLLPAAGFFQRPYSTVLTSIKAG
jgi:hypothetical protein